MDRPQLASSLDDLRLKIDKSPWDPKRVQRFVDIMATATAKTREPETKALIDVLKTAATKPSRNEFMDALRSVVVAPPSPSLDDHSKRAMAQLVLTAFELDVG